MRKVLRGLWLISAIALIAMGVFCLFNPGSAVVSLVYWLGFSVLFNGIMSIALFFSSRGEDGAGWILLDGIISTLFGVLLLFTNLWAFVAASLPIFFGIWVLVKGALSVIRSLQAKKAGTTYWYLLLVVGILGILFGVMTFARPFIAVFAIAVMVGIQLITAGIASITAWSIARKIRKSMM